jgi:hypothetical protein
MCCRRYARQPGKLQSLSAHMNTWTLLVVSVKVQEVIRYKDDVEMAG